MSFNKIILVGNLGRDPELKYSPQGKAVCNFSLATNEKRKDKEGVMQDVTTWYRCTAFSQAAEMIARHFVKGSQIYIEGKLSLSEWEDRDGKTRTTAEVKVSGWEFMGWKIELTDSAETPYRKPADMSGYDDELGF